MPAPSSSQVCALKDLKILDGIRKVFFTTTGLAISFHYPGGDDYDFYPIVEKNPYCEAIQCSREGMARCLKSDQDALVSARTQGKPFIYTCHAGLLNVVIPLIYKGRDLGALFIGQLFTRRQDESDFDPIFRGLEALGLKRDELFESFKKVKVFDHRELMLAIDLLSLMSNYIISVEDEMYLQSELYEKEKEILRYENTQMQLKNDLQKLSIRILEDKMQINSEQNPARSGSAQKRAIVIRAQEFIEENYDRDISLSDVARAVYLSPNYFSMVFKEFTCDSFSDYLNEVRIRKGKELLRDTELPIKHIVARVGFKDYNYFNRTFRKLVGIPPGLYRDSVSAAAQASPPAAAREAEGEPRPGGGDSPEGERS